MEQQISRFPMVEGMMALDNRGFYNYYNHEVYIYYEQIRALAVGVQCQSLPNMPIILILIITISFILIIGTVPVMHLLIATWPTNRQVWYLDGEDEFIFDNFYTQYTDLTQQRTYRSVVFYYYYPRASLSYLSFISF